MLGVRVPPGLPRDDIKMGGRQRYTVILVVILGVLGCLALGHGFQWILVELGWPNPWFVSEELSLGNLAGFLLGIGGTVFCLFNPKVSSLTGEVVEELSKVSWPSKEETSHATVVVVVTVLVCSAYLGVFDAVWLWLTDLVLQVRPEVTSG